MFNKSNQPRFLRLTKIVEGLRGLHDVKSTHFLCNFSGFDLGQFVTSPRRTLLRGHQLIPHQNYVSFDLEGLITPQDATELHSFEDERNSPSNILRITLITEDTCDHRLYYYVDLLSSLRLRLGGGGRDCELFLGFTTF